MIITTMVVVMTMMYYYYYYYCDMSTHCWIAQQSVARQPTGKQDFRAGAMTLHFRSKGMSRVFTWLPGDEPPSCQTARGVGDVT
jgi:hypothetical protein